MTQHVLWKLVDVSESELAKQLVSDKTQKERKKEPATEFKYAIT